MYKMKKRSKKNKSILHKHITTKIGALFLVAVALPLIIYASLQVQNTAQQAQMVQGDSFGTSTGYVQNSGVAIGHPNQINLPPHMPCKLGNNAMCPPGYACSPNSDDVIPGMPGVCIPTT